MTVCMDDAEEKEEINMKSRGYRNVRTGFGSLRRKFRSLKLSDETGKLSGAVKILGEALRPIFGLGEDQRSKSILNSEIYFVKYFAEAQFP